VAARHYAVAARKQSCSVLASAASLWTKKFPARTNAIMNRTVRYDQNLGYALSILGSFRCTVSYRSKWLSSIWLKFSDQTSHTLQVTSFDRVKWEGFTADAQLTTLIFNRNAFCNVI
jgi:hypothetical protein